jgi:hypothetical protein
LVATVHVEVREATGALVLRANSARGLARAFAVGGAFLPGRYEVTARADDGLRWAGSFSVGTAWQPDTEVEIELAHEER